MSPPSQPALNPALDRAALAAAFAAQGRLQISRVLTRESAQHIHTCLTQTPYSLAITGEPDATGLSPQDRQDRTRAAWRRVGLGGFQFVYDRHILSDHGEPYPDPAQDWAPVVAFLNGAEFLDLARQVTGIAAIAFADAQATLYRPGHFLTVHDDNKAGAGRLLAYVLSFTAAWRPEWGGLLHFLDDDGQPTQTYVPNFNSLRLFRVPAKHYVSAVAPYAMTGRYAITGWLRAR